MQEEEVRRARERETEAEEMVRVYETKEDEAIESLGDEGNFLTKLHGKWGDK